MQQVHADGATALGDDGDGPDGLDVIEAGGGDEVGLDALDELMRASHNEWLQEGREDERAKDAHAVVKHVDDAGEDVANKVTNGAEDREQGDVGGEQCDRRDEYKGDDLGNVLLSKLFDLSHEPSGKDSREHAALEGDLRNHESKEVPVRGTRGIEHVGVAVHEAGVHHDDTHEDAQDGVAAKALDRAVHHQDGQEIEGGRDDRKEAGDAREKLVALGEAALHAKEALGGKQRLEADDDGGAHEGGDDGDEDVGEHPQHREELALLVSFVGLDLGGADLLGAGELHERVVDLVDGARAKDNHELAAVEQHALDAVDLLELRLVVGARVLEHETQACHAVRGALEVVDAADVGEHLFGYVRVVHASSLVWTYLYYSTARIGALTDAIVPSVTVMAMPSPGLS